MLLDHLLRVHPVDVVGAEHDDVLGPLVVDQVQALVDRSAEPANQCGPRRICAGTGVT